MEKSNASIESVCEHLCTEYKAIEISLNELMSFDESVYDNISSNTKKAFKVEDRDFINTLLSKNEKEEILITMEHIEKINSTESSDYNFCSSYINKISTGKLIIVTLESDDNVSISGFTMQGSGQKLYDYLISTISDEIEKTYNPLDETISELSHYRPYGKYFK